jgi:hypothetical protein
MLRWPRAILARSAALALSWSRLVTARTISLPVSDPCFVREPVPDDDHLLLLQHHGEQLFCSLDELSTALEERIKLWNEGARPFTWTRIADQITNRICCYCSRISGPGH